MANVLRYSHRLPLSLPTSLVNSTFASPLLLQCTQSHPFGTATRSAGVSHALADGSSPNFGSSPPQAAVIKLLQWSQVLQKRNLTSFDGRQAQKLLQQILLSRTLSAQLPEVQGMYANTQ